MKYSICITTKADEDTIPESLNSILRQIDDDYEIVLVNAGAPLEIKGVRVIHRECNRGEGRQLAFEMSIGKYVIDQIDTDDIHTNIPQLVEYYHRNYEGKLLNMLGFMIAPRELIKDAGGWPPTQSWEDWGLYYRVAKLGKFVYIPFETRANIGKSNKTVKQKLKIRYSNSYDAMKMGYSPFRSVGAHIPLSPLCWLYYLVALNAGIDFHRKREKVILDMRNFDVKNYIPEEYPKVP